MITRELRKTAKKILNVRMRDVERVLKRKASMEILWGMNSVNENDELLRDSVWDYERWYILSDDSDRYIHAVYPCLYDRVDHRDEKMAHREILPSDERQTSVWELRAHVHRSISLIGVYRGVERSRIVRRESGKNLYQKNILRMSMGKGYSHEQYFSRKKETLWKMYQYFSYKIQ